MTPHTRATPAPAADSSRTPDSRPTRAAVADVPPGLAGVVVTTTEIGDVLGAEGWYHYRGYSAVELAEHCTFEDVWFLLMAGHLPDSAERAAFAPEIATAGRLAPAVVTTLPTLVRAMPTATPLALMRAALPLAAEAAGVRPLVDSDPAERRRSAIVLAAQVPALLGTLHALRRGASLPELRTDLGYAASYL